MLYRSTTQEPVMRSLSSRRSTSLQGIKMRSPWVYPLAYDGTGRQEKIYQVSAYTTRYRSWGGTWTPWNTGRPWEQGNIEIFNARVTLPDHGAHTQAAQYFVFTDGAFRKPLCKNIPAG